MSNDDLITSALRIEWHRLITGISPLPTGLMSRGWAVTTGDERLVVRLVDQVDRQALEAAAAATERLRERGVQVGEPIRTLTGGLTVATPIGLLSVHRRVPGRALDGHDPVDQQWWGDRLGAAHRALNGFGHPGLRQWNELRVTAPHLDVEPWLRPAVADAVAAMTRLTVTDQLTYGVLHGDPAPGIFVVDPNTGRAGLRDWGIGGTGPLVYDVATAVIYAGGPTAAREFLDGYLAAGPVGRDELAAALPVLLRFRWAVQADRLAHDRASSERAARGRAGHRRVAHAELGYARDVLQAMAAAQEPA